MRWRKPSRARKRSSSPTLSTPLRFPEQIPVPQVAIWQPSKVPVKKIVPALPQKPAPSEVKPSVESPNEELTLADVKISSTFHPTPKPIVAASTTSPVTVHAPPQPPVPLATTSLTAKPPTPAALLSHVKPAHEGRRRHPASCERECGGQIPWNVDRAIEGRRVSR